MSEPLPPIVVHVVRGVPGEDIFDFDEAEDGPGVWPLPIRGMILNVQDDLARIRDVVAGRPLPTPWAQLTRNEYLERIADSLEIAAQGAEKHIAQAPFPSLLEFAEPYHATPVKEFHQAFGHPVEEAPTTPTIEQRLLRVKLLAEELTEFANACNVVLRVNPVGDQEGGYAIAVEVHGDDERGADLVEAADALGDLRYVVDGGNLIFGFPGAQILREIHASNMSKLGVDGKPITREDGKTLKGPNYFKPDIATILHRAQFAESAASWARMNSGTETLVNLIDLKPIPMAVIEAWTDDECRQVDSYCMAVHYNASDNNDVVVPPMPAQLKPYEWQPGDPDRYKSLGDGSSDLWPAR